jgi:hypothetical protein
VASEVGLNFHHFNFATGHHYMPEIMGAGVALLDYDNDGDLDVYLVQSSRLDHGCKLLSPPPSGWRPGNRLFKNLLAETGELRFVDVTEKAGVGHIGYGMGVAAGDYDNDGFLDLYVTNFGHNVLYHNNGDGTFTDVTKQAGVDDTHWSTSAAWVDVEGDGWLDLFVCNYVDFTVQGNRGCSSPVGEPDYCTPKMYHAVPSRLFRNLRNGKFEDISEASHINSSYGPALGVLSADFNGDGLTDIYVANDTSANLLWLNQGDGTFRESALESPFFAAMLTDSSTTPPLISDCCNRHSAIRALAPNGSTMTTTAGWIFSLPMVASRSEAHRPPADPGTPSPSSYFITRAAVNSFAMCRPKPVRCSE